ncbi:hypothetical protein KY347_00280 [Candidatus Woesearchaeota archaeon]|nr:hypothetical protein [Candidatus Woesearchaeota archaeon]
MDDLEKDFLELFQKVFRAYGLRGLCVKVVALLYLEPDETSMDDICSRTGYSLASISNTMKMLESLGMVRRITKPKTKKIFFYMEKNLIKLNISKLKAIRDNALKPIEEHTLGIIGKYRKKIKGEKDKRKLQVIEDYHKQAIAFESLLNNWIQDLDKISEKSQK